METNSPPPPELPTCPPGGHATRSPAAQLPSPYLNSTIALASCTPPASNRQKYTPDATA
jgi:hypothetical protein